MAGTLYVLVHAALRPGHSRRSAPRQAVALSFFPDSLSFSLWQPCYWVCFFTLPLLKLSFVRYPSLPGTAEGEGFSPYLIACCSHGLKYCIHSVLHVLRPYEDYFVLWQKKWELSVDTAFAVIGQRSFTGVLAWGNLAFRVIEENFVIKSVADKVPSRLLKQSHLTCSCGLQLISQSTQIFLYHHWVTSLSSPATGEAP